MTAFSLALALSACGTGDGDENADGGAEDPSGEASPEESEAPFFEGKTVTILTPTSAGGSVDITSRFIATFLEKHLEGSPTVIVENVVGGNQLIGANEYAIGREPDGTNLFVNGTSTNISHVLDDPGAQFDYADFTPMMALPVGIVIMAHGETGVTTAADLANPTGELIYGGQRLSGSDLSRVLAFDALDIDYRPVFGYESGSSLTAAFQQGEITLNYTSTKEYFANMTGLAEEGVLSPIMTMGQVSGTGEIVRDPAMPDLPTVAETYEILHGRPLPPGEIVDAMELAIAIGTTVSNVLWIHGDAPEEAKEAIQDSFGPMFEDPEFIAGIEDIQSGYDPIIGADLEGALNKVMAPDPEIVQWMNDYIEQFEE